MANLDKTCLTYRLNGYVDAISFLDGECNTVIANAYLAPVTKDCLIDSLKAELNQVVELQYSIGTCLRLLKPWTRELHQSLLGFFFKCPFGIPDLARNIRVSELRAHYVLHIVDFIGMITDDFSCDEIWVVDISRSDGYTGRVYVFPIGQEALLLQTISINK